MFGPRKGVLPMQLLRTLMANECITGVDESLINPASIDLPLSEEAYKLPCVFQLGKGEHVRTVLEIIGKEPHDLSKPLEVGVTYIIRIAGNWKLPQNVYGYANPKSTAGRLNLFARVMADNVEMYDMLSNGWHEREMWLLVRPDSFRIKLTPGRSVSQMRFFDGPSFLDPLRTELVADKEGLIFTQKKAMQVFYREMKMWKDTIQLTLAVGERFGFEGQMTNEVIDFEQKKVFDTEDNPFFKRIEPSRGGYRLSKDGFYILSTAEMVRVPTYLSAELRAIDPRLGEFRSHAAGYIDPGWGCGADGKGRGRAITLELIPHEDMFVRDGQTIARLRYEHMKEPPDVPYDAAGSNYTKQSGPTLPKQFY